MSEKRSSSVIDASTLRARESGSPARRVWRSDGCDMGDRVSSARLVVEAAAAFLAEPALVDVPAQQRARAIRDPGSNGRVVLLDREDHIEADSVHEPEGRNARAGEDPPHLVDVLGG